MMGAVAGEMIYNESNDQDDDRQTGYFYPAGHLGLISIVHGAKLPAGSKIDLTKPGKDFANPVISHRPGSMGIKTCRVSS
jgi:hypothetical protein